jgi:hypothetical protein
MGMTEQAKAVRLLEIESDLWEHFADRSAERVSPAAISVEALGRMLRGVPSDIAWRIQAEGFHVNVPSLVTTARGFALSVEALSMANATATISGLFCLGTALTRLGLVPRWTLVLPAAGFGGTVLWPALGPAFGDAAWLATVFGFIAVALWLLFCGIWLLFGGSKLQPKQSLPAHT